MTERKNGDMPGFHKSHVKIKIRKIIKNRLKLIKIVPF